MKKKLLKTCIIGKTNAGKSTLLNNFIGELISITNKKINTTEDLILGIINIKNNQLIFYDTPGLSNLKSKNPLNKKNKIYLWNGLNESDLIIYLVDIKKYNQKEILNNLNTISEIKKDILVVFNKNDLVDQKLVLPIIDELNKLTIINAFFSISAKKNRGIQNLVKYLLSKTYYASWIYNENEITNKDDIFISNQATRNAILNLLHDEIPYNIKVSNILFKYLKSGDLKIKQQIEINNIRYKKIILGKKGSKIKEIRKMSQKKISKIFNSKIHLYINIVIDDSKKI